jgi:hypothetical protein
MHLVLNGVLPDAVVARWLARRYQLPLAGEAEVQHITPEVARLLPEEIVYAAGLLPLRRSTERSLVVGWVDPTEPGRVDEAEFFSGYAIEPQVLTCSQMASSYERLFDRPWKVPLRELLTAQRRLHIPDFPAEKLFDWLDLLVTLELDIRQLRQDTPSPEPMVAADVRSDEPVYELTPDLRRPGTAPRTTSSEHRFDFVADRESSSQIPLRHLYSGAWSAAPLAQARPASETPPMVELGPELIRAPGTPPPESAPTMQTAPPSALRNTDFGSPSAGVDPSSGAPRRFMNTDFGSPSAGVDPSSGAPRRLVLDVDLPVSQPPVKPAEQAEAEEAMNASLITGMFRAPTAEQIELEQARRRLQNLPHYRRSERSGSLQGVSSEPDSHRSGNGDHLATGVTSAESSPGRPRHLTPASSYTTASFAAAVPLPVSSGTFHQLPTRIFDASGPAQGPVRAAFRSAVKGLNACGSREAIAREIVESLGIVFANVLLLHPRMPVLQVWDASLRRGSPRLAGAEIELVDEGFWQRIRAEQLTFRGALLPDDPLRQLVGRELGSDTLVLPLSMNHRTVAILVLDNGRDQSLPSCGGLFKPFDEAISGAFRRMIMTNKRPQWQPN